MVRWGLSELNPPGYDEHSLGSRVVTESRHAIYQLRDLKKVTRASLVAQWLRICLPMQGTRVRALVWEDPTCRGVTKPVSHNY